MKTLRKKVVLLGAFGVGKTSLVRRFVSNEFSDNYLSTIGVKVEKRLVKLNNVQVELLIWDIAGDDEFFKLQASYLRGASGVLMVADATRAWTVHKAQELKAEFQSSLAGIPWHFIINKSDLAEDPSLKEAIATNEFADATLTSAKTGNAVEAVFEHIASDMVRGQ